MHNAPELIELANVTQDARREASAAKRLAAAATGRAGPFARARCRVGRGLIAAGTRIAYGRARTVTR